MRAQRRQCLDRDAATERQVDSFVDDAGAALSDTAFELEPPWNRLRHSAGLQRAATAAAVVVLCRVHPATGALVRHWHLVESVESGEASTIASGVLRDL